MIKTNKNLIFTAGIAFFLGIGTAYLTLDSGTFGQTDGLSDQNNPASTTPNLVIKDVGGVGIVTGNGFGDATVEPVSVGEDKDAVLVPDLDREIVFPSSYSTDVKNALTEKINVARNSLRGKPDQFDVWLELALYLKQSDDYEGAKIIWEFLNQAYPSQSISFGNLGDLYHFYLKDFPKSEVNYLTAIKNEPTRVDLYRGLYELYTYSYKTDTNAAEEALLAGLEKSPESLDLLVLSAKYYVGVKDWGEARKFYEKAIEAAKSSGNTYIENALKEELNSLPK